MIVVNEMNLVSYGQNIGRIRLEYSKQSRPAKLSVADGPSYLEYDYIGFDYFYALQNLRLDLEKHDCFLACLGCLKDVYPSGMSADMSNGLIAYQANNAKLTMVHIFDELSVGQYINLSTVAEQKETRRKLVRSGNVGEF